ncbi:hypothetical protein HDU92_008255, partial [Lobulomyces angularis]
HSKNLRLERLIGVLYVQRTESESHYSLTKIAEEYDMIIHLDETSALQVCELINIRPGTVNYFRFEKIDPEMFELKVN